MAYTVHNFKTKKALKEAVASSLEKGATLGLRYAPVRCYQPSSIGRDLSNFTGKLTLEGPHYPAAHTWYAEAELKDGIVIKVK